MNVMKKTVEVLLPKSGRVLGVLELRFVSQFQVYQLPLKSADVADLRREGVALRLTKGSDLEIFSGGAEAPAVLLPHLLVPGAADAKSEYFARLNSLACVQQFGWMEGCVLDGLLDLAARPQYAHLKAAVQKHLALFSSAIIWFMKTICQRPVTINCMASKAACPSPHWLALRLSMRCSTLRYNSGKRANALAE